MAHQVKIRATRALVLASAIATVSTLQMPASGANRTWSNTGTDFNDPGSWNNGAPGAGDVAQFDTDAVTNPNLTSSLTIQGITFGAGGAAGTLGDGYTISSSDPSIKLTLTNTGTFEVFNSLFHNTDGSNTISAPIVLGAASGTQNFVVTAGSVHLSGAITNTNAVRLRKDGAAGTLYLSGDNSQFTGTIELYQGSLHFNSANALGAGTLILGKNFGTNIIDNSSGADILSLTNPTIDLDGHASNPTTFTFLGSNSLHMGNGDILLGSGPSRVIRVDANRLTLGGRITGLPSGSNVLEKLGNGVLELAGQQDSAANVRVSEGVLLLSHADALPTGNLAIRSKASTAAGVIGLGAGDFNRALGSGAGQIQFAGGGGYAAYGGFAAYGGNRIVNLGGNSSTVTWNTGGFVSNFNSFVLGAESADATVDFQNPINFTNRNQTIQVDNGSAAIDAILSGQLSSDNASGGLTKAGLGTLALTGTNTYAGNTTVSAGTLLINGANNGTGSVTVATDATLGGTGSIAGTVNVNGILSPGASPGTLTVNALNINDGATYYFEGGDLTVVTNQLDLNDHWILSLGSGLQDGGSVVLFTFGSLAADPDFDVTYDVSNAGFIPTHLSLEQVGNTIVLNGVSVVPEPSALAFVGLGACAAGLRRRRHSR